MQMKQQRLSLAMEIQGALFIFIYLFFAGAPSSLKKSIIVNITILQYVKICEYLYMY